MIFFLLSRCHPHSSCFDWQPICYFMVDVLFRR